MPRRAIVGTAAAVCLCVALLGLLFVGRAHQSFADSPAGTPRIEIDMDPTNGTGPCNPVDATVHHQTGDTYSVAICLTDVSSPPAALQFELLYDDTLNECLPVECSPSDGHCRDSSPDLNAGATVFSSPSLGTGWECELGTPPSCDDDPATGPGHGMALLMCFSTHEPTLPAGPGVSSPIAEVKLRSFYPGVDNLSLAFVDVADRWGIHLVEPDLGLGESLGGSDTVSGTPVTPEAVPTATGTPAPTFTALPPGPPLGTVELDMDPTNGTSPCDPIDKSVQHNVGDVYSIAVCLTDWHVPPASFQFDLAYDDSANQCIPTACAADDSLCFDSNPDANLGSTTFSTPSLGSGWSCDPASISPNCDFDSMTGSGPGTASMICLSLGHLTLPVGDGVSSAVAEVRLRAAVPGTQTVVLKNVTAADADANEVMCGWWGSVCDEGSNTNLPHPILADNPAGKQDAANLWVMKSCVDPKEGEGCLEIDQSVYNIFDTPNPNDLGDVPEGLGAWEHKITFDHNFVSISTAPDNAWLTSGGRVVNANDAGGCFVSIQNENSLLEGCVTKDAVGANGSR